MIVFNRHGEEAERSLASHPMRCYQLIRPLLKDYKRTHNFKDIFENGHLTKAEVDLFKEDPSAINHVTSLTHDLEEQNYAFASMALIKKKYFLLKNEDVIHHFKSLYRKCS